MARPAGFQAFFDGWLSTAGRRLTLILTLALLACAALGTQYYRVETKVEAFRRGTFAESETLYVPPKPVLRALSLGHEQFMADMLFVRGYGYFLAHLFSDRRFQWLETYISSIIHLDPDNPRIYRWASQMVKLGQLITNECVDRSIHYSRLGISHFPNDWRFYMDIGFNLYFEYDYADDDERERLQSEALEYFTIAASLPNSELDPNFIAELYMRRNDTKMALFQAYRAYHEASDMERRYLRRRIAQLESKDAARVLEEKESRWKASYSFLPFPVFALFDETVETVAPPSWRLGESTYRTYRAETPGRN